MDEEETRDLIVDSRDDIGVMEDVLPEGESVQGERKENRIKKYLQDSDAPFIKFIHSYLTNLLSIRTVLICSCCCCLCVCSFFIIIIISVFAPINVRFDPGLFSVIVEKDGKFSHHLYNSYTRTETRNVQIKMPDVSRGGGGINQHLKSACIDDYVNKNMVYWLLDGNIMRTKSDSSDSDTIVYLSQQYHDTKMLGISVWKDGSILSVGQEIGGGIINLYRIVDQIFDKDSTIRLNELGTDNSLQIVSMGTDHPNDQLYLMVQETMKEDETPVTHLYQFDVSVHPFNKTKYLKMDDTAKNAKKMIAIGYDKFEKTLLGVVSEPGEKKDSKVNEVYKVDFNASDVFAEKCVTLPDDEYLTFGTTFSFYDEKGMGKQRAYYHVGNFLYEDGRTLLSQDITTCEDYRVIGKGKILPGELYALVLNPHQKI